MIKRISAILQLLRTAGRGTKRLFLDIYQEAAYHLNIPPFFITSLCLLILVECTPGIPDALLFKKA
jgi:hypothetical protein